MVYSQDSTEQLNCTLDVFDRLFAHFDEENDGYLTRKELKGLIIGLGVERHNGEVPGEEEVGHWMAEFDVDNRDSKISWEEFAKGITRWMKSSNSRKKKSSEIEVSHSGRWDTEAQASVLSLLN